MRLEKHQQISSDINMWSHVSDQGTVLSRKLIKKLNLLICSSDSTYGYIINKHNSIKFHKLRYQVKNRLHEPTIINQNNKAQVLNRCPCPNQRCFRAFCWLLIEFVSGTALNLPHPDTHTRPVRECARKRFFTDDVKSII
jgi:hypothetical protein